MSAGKKNRLHDNYTHLNKVKLIRGGKPYFDCLLQMIASATDTIHIQTYIYDDDSTGQLVAEALKEAVGRNVNVYLLADGYASKRMSNHFIRNLCDAGIHFRHFDPLFKSNYFYLGRRLHHKVAVADSRYAMVGGINITDRYNDMPGKPAWLDFAMYVEGEAAAALCQLCWETWKNYPSAIEQNPCIYPARLNFLPTETSDVSIRRNDWVKRKNEISGTYAHMLRTAESQVTILCSYFLPGKFIRRQLRYATQKGVRIRVISAGISDVRLAKYAERYMYNWLLRNHIELYEYQANVLHGKIAVCDSQWLTIGSYNVNNISAYASIELNLNIRNPALAADTEKQLQQIIENDCIPITMDYYRQTRNPLKFLGRWLSYQVFRILFYLFTFYFKHRK